MRPLGKAGPGPARTEAPNREGVRCGAGTSERTLILEAPPTEDTMHQHHHLTQELARLHRQDLRVDADRHRRTNRRRGQDRRFLRRS